MKRINLYIEDVTYINLKGLPGTMTEHIKRAIYDYIKNLYKVNVSASESKRGDENG